MPLEFQVQQYGFRFGVDEGVDPVQAPPGTLLQAENVEWLKTGQLRKRRGTSALALSILGGGSLSSASRLMVRGDELAMVSGSTLYAYSPTATGWKAVGPVPNVGVTWATIVDTVGGVTAYDVASGSGYRIEAWTDAAVSAGLYVRMVDEASGTLVVLPTKLTTGAIGVRALIVNGKGVIVSRTSSADIKAWSINLSTFAVSSATTLRSDGVQVDGVDGWDACVIGNNFVIAYIANPITFALYSYNNSFVQQATGGVTSELNGACHMSIDGASGERIYVVYQSGAAAPSPVRIAIANAATLAETVAPVDIEAGYAGGKATNIGVCRYDATNCVVSYATSDAGTPFAVRTTTYKISSTATVAATSLRSTWGSTPLSRPFMVNGSCYLAAVDTPGVVTSAYPVDSQSLIFAVDVSAATATNHPHRVVGTVDVFVGGTCRPQGAPPGSASVSGTTARLAMPAKTEVLTATGTSATFRQGLRLVTMTASDATRPADMWRPIVRNGELFLACGQLTAYDGLTAFDYGFVRAPTMSTFTPYNGAGSMVLGTYLYGLSQEYRSANFLYRSRVDTSSSGGSSTLAGVEDTVNLTITGGAVGNKQTDATGFGSAIPKPTIIVVYRSVVSGTVRQRLAANSVFVNQTAGQYTFTDLQSDATAGLSAKAAAYTTGGILDDEQPPGAVSMFTFADRLWVLAGDLRTWWYSKAFADDEGVAPGFSTSFRVVFDEEQVCGAAMDDKAVFFSASGIRYMLGQGPAPDGTGSDFSAPARIQTDTGCATPRSVVAMPDGIMYQATGGELRLLTRGLEIVSIGKPVQDVLAAYPNITSAVLVPAKDQVRFTANTNNGTAHVVLVFDYHRKQWTTFRYTHGTYGAGSIVDAVLWGDTYAFAMSDGTVYTESSSSYLDSGSTWVPVTLKTAWLSAAGPLAFHSVRRFTLFGRAVTDHNLTVAVGFDGDAAAETHTFASPSAVTSAGADLDPQIPIGTRRKCQQIQFTITDATPTSGTVGTGQGPMFSMMGIEVGIKRGLSRQPATKKG